MTMSVASAKLCSTCGANVAGQPRMKDEWGKYWCLKCGEKAQKKLKAAAAKAAKKASSAGSGFSLGALFNSGSPDAGKMVKYGIVMGVLAVIAALRFTGVF